MRKIRSVLSVALAAVLLGSCASLQKDLLVTSADEAANSEIGTLEQLIVPLDAGFADSDLVAIRGRIAELERKGVKDAVYEARLEAWSGRLFLLEGKRSEAERRLQRSASLLPGDTAAMVLSARLEPNAERRLSHLDFALEAEPLAGPLLIERARCLFDLRRFRESVAAFDTAFPLLPPVYETVYGGQRLQAWDQRNLASDSSGKMSTIVSKSEITWRDAIELTAAETEFFRSLSGGKQLSAEKFFPRLKEKGILPQSALGLDGPVSRSESAWFFWHLSAEVRSDERRLNRYSTRYAAVANPVSPVPDVFIGSPFFDSVMGCIETEILSLPDGKAFYPDRRINGAAFLQGLQKIGY